MINATTETTWQQAISKIVRHSLIERTEGRCPDLSFKDYNANKGQPLARNKFSDAWKRSVKEMFYRLRSAKTRRIFSESFAELFCGYSQYQLKDHFDKIAELLQSQDQWEDLRDIAMLSLSANSYLKSANPEENNESVS